VSIHRVAVLRSVRSVDLLPPDDPWAGYARTLVVIVRPDAPNLVVAAAPAGETGAWPWPTPDVVHVLTAWDPGDARPGDVENRRRQADLEGELQARSPGELWTAVGVDPVSEHREEGVAVTGLDLDVVVALGARYGQDAIFEWTSQEWAIVACRGGRREAFGWSVGPGGEAGAGE
jgi:hypothetical protein